MNCAIRQHISLASTKLSKGIRKSKETGGRSSIHRRTWHLWVRPWGAQAPSPWWRLEPCLCVDVTQHPQQPWVTSRGQKLNQVHQPAPHREALRIHRTMPVKVVMRAPAEKRYLILALARLTFYLQLLKVNVRIKGTMMTFVRVCVQREREERAREIWGRL